MPKVARLGFYAPGIGQVKASDPKNQRVLESIASDPSLVKLLDLYNYHIESLTDSTKEEENKCLGHNVGMGQEIAINCNTCNPFACDITTYEDSATVMDTMIHELAHCDETGGLSEHNRKHHNKAFHDRRRELKRMYIEFESWKQKGTQLGGKKKCSPWLSLLWGGVLYYGCKPFHLVLCGVLTIAAANNGYGVDLDKQEVREQRVDYYTKKINNNKKKRRSKSKVRSSTKKNRE